MLTEDTLPICRHWQNAGVSFDAVTVGYLAEGFVERVIDATKEATPFGAEFESQLPWLWEQL